MHVLNNKAINPVTSEEHSSLPTYLKAQITLELLNNIINKLANYSTSKKSADERLCITESELKTELDTGNFNTCEETDC